MPSTHAMFDSTCRSEAQIQISYSVSEGRASISKRVQPISFAGSHSPTPVPDQSSAAAGQLQREAEGPACKVEYRGYVGII